MELRKELDLFSARRKTSKGHPGKLCVVASSCRKTYPVIGKSVRRTEKARDSRTLGATTCPESSADWMRSATEPGTEKSTNVTLLRSISLTEVTLKYDPRKDF